MWKCIQCETNNEEQNRFCIICGAAREETRTAVDEEWREAPLDEVTAAKGEPAKDEKKKSHSQWIIGTVVVAVMLLCVTAAFFLPNMLPHQTEQLKSEDTRAEELAQEKLEPSVVSSSLENSSMLQSLMDAADQCEWTRTTIDNEGYSFEIPKVWFEMLNGINGNSIYPCGNQERVDFSGCINEYLGVFDVDISCSKESSLPYWWDQTNHIATIEMDDGQILHAYFEASEAAVADEAEKLKFQQFLCERVLPTLQYTDESGYSYVASLKIGPFEGILTRMLADAADSDFTEISIPSAAYTGKNNSAYISVPEVWVNQKQYGFIRNISILVEDDSCYIYFGTTTSSYGAGLQIIRLDFRRTETASISDPENTRKYHTSGVICTGEGQYFKAGIEIGEDATPAATQQEITQMIAYLEKNVIPTFRFVEGTKPEEQPKENAVTLSGVISAPMACGTYYPMDVNGDGVSEQVMVETFEKDHKRYCRVSGKDGAGNALVPYVFPVENLEPWPAEEFYFVNLDTSDSDVEIAVSLMPGSSMPYMTRFLRLVNGGFQEVGVAGGVLRGGENASLPDLKINGDGSVIGNQLSQVMQSWYLEVHYRLQGGMLCKVEQPFYAPIWFNDAYQPDIGKVLTARKDLVCYTDEALSASQILPAGSVIYPLACDGKSVVKFQRADTQELIWIPFYDSYSIGVADATYTAEGELASWPFENLQMFG